MQLRCPTCHAKHPVESFIEDEAAAELLKVAFRGGYPRSLLTYLALFRSEKRDLAWSRVLRLAEEVMGLDADAQRLEAALAETVEAIRAKREAGGDQKPMKNHNYLKRVLESIPTSTSAAVAGPIGSQVVKQGRPSKHLGAIAQLEAHRRG